jgi:hypothetical protein
MMSTTMGRYAPKVSTSDSLQLPESQILCLYLKSMKNTKTTKIEGIPTGFEGQDHQEKRHTNLMCDSTTKSHKETPPNPSYEIPKKGSENHRKEKGKEQQERLRNHAVSSIHTIKDL